MLLLGAFFLFMTLITVIRGEPPLMVVWLGKPKVCMAIAVAGILSGYFSLYAGLWTTKEYKIAIGKIILLGFSILMALAVGEIVLRIYFERAQGFSPIEKLGQHQQKGKIHLTSSNTPLAHIVCLSSDKKLVYELIPGLNTEFGHKSVKINSSGMREETDYPESPEPNTLRIIGIGDSGMFGWNTMQGECYLDVLEKNLAKQNLASKVEVLNMAVPGYNTEQEVEILELRGLKYKPDIVIVGWCDNDFSPPFFLYKKKDYLQAKSSILYTFLFYRKQGHFEPEMLKMTEIDKQNIDPFLLKETGIEGVTNEMKRLASLASEHKFKVLLFGPMNAHIVKICETLGLDYYNTLTEIPDGKYPQEYAIHFMHPKPKGHEVLAEHLEKCLKAKGWIK